MALPILRRYKLPKVPVAPTKRIVTDEDVIFWKTTAGYQDYGLFIRRLNLAVIGYDLPYTPRPHTLSEVSRGSVIGASGVLTVSIVQAVHKTIQMLDKIATWVDEIPPQETTQRFGNLAFRDWGKRLEEVCCCNSHWASVSFVPTEGSAADLPTSDRNSNRPRCLKLFSQGNFTRRSHSFSLTSYNPLAPLVGSTMGQATSSHSGCSCVS